MKLISREINEKTIDHVMAGIESIIGKKSQFFVIEWIRNFDVNHTKKWLVRKDAEDPLTMKFERWTLDEHFARLYGPTVMMSQRVTESQSKRQSVAQSEMSDEDRKRLIKALANSPFIRYRHKSSDKGSHYEIHRSLREQNDWRYRMLKRSLTVQSGSGIPEQSVDDVVIELQPLTLPERKRSHTISESGDSLTARMIRQKYENAKITFKPANPVRNSVQDIQEEEELKVERETDL